MSVSFDDGSGAGRNWPRVRSFIAHNQLKMLVSWLVLVLVIFWFIDDWNLWAQAFIAILVLVSWLIVETKALSQHAVRFCDRCLDEAPLDGKYDAEKYMNWLKWFHFLDQPRNAIGRIVLICVGVVLMPSWLFFPYLVALNFPVLRAADHHRRLAPWCPICHPGDNGGDNGFTPEPDPVIEGEKVR